MASTGIKTAAKTRKKAAAADLPIPKSMEEAAQAVAEIGRERRAIAGIERTLNERLTEVRTEYAEMAAAHRERAERLFEGLKMYCEVNRHAICPGDRKSKALPTGTIAWRMTPPSVRLTKAEEVLKELQERELWDYIRTKHEVDKEAILSAPAGVAGIKGIAITQREEFVVEPAEDEVPSPATKATVGREEVRL